MNEPIIRWRGSVTDLATDCAFLLTPQQGLDLAAELIRFHESERLRAEKYKAGTWAGNSGSHNED